MKTVLICFTKITAEQPSLTQYELPMYIMKEKLTMLSSTDKKFMISLIDFGRFSIESRFPYFNSHSIVISVLVTLEKEQ